jgi:hypothetical protein
MKKTTVLLALAVALSSLSVTAVDAQILPVPSGSVAPDGWDRGSGKWENGNVGLYAEGETAAALTAINNQQGVTYWTDICLQVFASPFNPATDPYAFTGFEPWDTTVTPPSFPDGTPVDYTDGNWYNLTHDFVWGYKVDIISVSAPERGGGTSNQCDPNYYGVRVTFTALANSGAYIVWGGHLAQPGDPLPSGFVPPSTVPEGRGASAMGGTFKTRVEGSGDKAINFNPPAAAPTAVTLVSFLVTPAGRSMQVEWETATEINSLGFNLYRAESPDGLRIRLNESLIPSQAPGSPVGAKYQYVDDSIETVTTYYYFLEEVDVTSRATPYGPVSALSHQPAAPTIHRMFLPWISR